ALSSVRRPPPTSTPVPYTTLFRSRVASPAGVAGGINIGTIVRRCDNQHAIAVDVDIGRGRPAPGETHRIYSTHLERGDLDQYRRSEEHTSELQSLRHLVCRLLLEK